MDQKRDGPYIPEQDLTPEQRIDAIAEILLDAIREMQLQENRDKVLRCRARKKGVPVSPEPAEPERSPNGASRRSGHGSGPSLPASSRRMATSGGSSS